MREDVTISHRGASYEIGRGPGFYGIWAIGAPGSAPLEWWYQTPDGWAAAWLRFSQIEAPGSIIQVGQDPAAFPGPAQAADQAGQPAYPAYAAYPAPAGAGPVGGPAGSGGAGSGIAGGAARAGLAGRGPGSLAAAALLGLGVILGIVGLFPGYFGSQSLASQADQWVPHLIYLAGWAAAAVLIVLGGARHRTGALLALGLSVVTFGLFIADAGTAASGGGANAFGTGLVLSLIGWALCAAGSAVACMLRPAGGTARQAGQGRQWGAVITLILAGIGATIAFAPSWDRYVLHTSVGASQTITAGNAFANPGVVITGDVLTMIAIVALVIVAGLWRPARYGAALLAGVIIPLIAQAISAFVQIGQGISPAQFGLSAGQAARLGLTISSGLTLAFWIYCAFVVALCLSCALLGTTPNEPVAQPPPVPAPPGYPFAAGHPGGTQVMPSDTQGPAVSAT